jgi:hypothetical protein
VACLGAATVLRPPNLCVFVNFGAKPCKYGVFCTKVEQKTKVARSLPALRPQPARAATG